MSSRHEALSRLFRDDDPETLALVKEQLVMQGELAVPDLDTLVRADSAIVAAHAQDILHAIAGKSSASALETLLRREGQIPLEDACWLISSALTPWIDIGESRQLLDGWGRELFLKISENPPDRVAVLTRFLHEDLRFEGNTRDYYVAANSLLPEVMRLRKGLPLTLTLITMFLGQRAGIPVHGVNLPGHFIARCGETYFDPFHGGRILSIADCADILARQEIELCDEHLENPESRQIIARLLANLRHAYDLEGASWQKRMVDRWMEIVTGECS
jgi:hypothetical protein